MFARILSTVCLTSLTLQAQPPAGAPVTPPATVPMPPVPAQAPTNPGTPPVATSSPAATPSWPTQIAGKDLAAWLKDLRESTDGSLRETAAKVIPHFGPSARSSSLKPLIQQLNRETDPGVRVNIIIALGAIGADKPEEARQIVEALNSIILRSGPASPVRLYAARALASYGHDAALAIPTLLNIDEDPAWETRQAVALTLGRIARGPEPKTPKETRKPNLNTLNSLAKRLQKEESSPVRLEIAQSLLLLGPPSYRPEIPGDYEKAIKPFLDAVTKKLETEPDPATRVWLMMTQMTYDGRAFNDTSISKIADFINGPDLGGKIAALRALALLGEKSKAALPSMMNSLKWPEPELVAEGIIALAAMKTMAKDALPELERIRNGKDEYLKPMAAQAIEIISGAKNPAPAPPPMPPKK